jgi:serine protease AprX
MRLTRTHLALFASVLGLLAPLAAGVAGAHAGDKESKALVSSDLLQAAKQNERAMFDVLVTGDGSEDSAKLAGKVAHMLEKGKDAKDLGSQLQAQFESVETIELNVSGKDVTKLSKQKGLLSIVVNADITPEKWGNSQKWDDTVKANWFWGSPQAKTQAATIAIVDSGVDNSNGQFGNRLLGQFDLGGGSAQGDPRGHGTVVAALAAGAGLYSGVAPTANIVSLDVFDNQGRGTTGNVIRAADWILQNKDQYNIRVVNFSLQTSQSSSFMYDPLDQAVERLWEAGIVVTAAAGNYAIDGKPSGVLYAPANDPFVITVGAVDIHGSGDPKDDLNSPWSSYGYTNDGFAKPELGAPGRYLIAEVPGASTIFADYPNNIVKANTIQLSGTSFAAPIVAGMAADLLGTHPDWTPDQVKGVLMASAMPVTKAATNSVGVGEVNLQKAFEFKPAPPNPNYALEQFLIADPSGGALPIFDAGTWISVAQSDASWNSASWNSASWNSVSWNSASWNSASWNSASWNSASWTSSSWNSASWNSVYNDAINDGRGDG